MTQMAKVTRIFTKGYAEVAVQDGRIVCGRDCSACGEPGCIALNPEDGRFVAENFEKAERGDIVMVEPAEPSVDRTAAAAYLMPPVMLAFGLVLGTALQYPMADRVVIAAIFAGLTYVTAWIMNRRSRMRRALRYRIIKVCKKEKPAYLP